MRSSFLPEWLSAHEERDTLYIWSAGCCSGEEAWSLYFLAQEVLADHQVSKQIRLTATDINSEFLQKAEKGWYPPNSFRIRDDGFRSRYFQASGRGYQIRSNWLNAIRFQQWNLHESGLPIPEASQDLICCRNVLIYFAADEAEAVIRRFLKALRPQGVLLIGAVEASVATQAGLYGKWAGDNYVLTPAALTTNQRPPVITPTGGLTTTDEIENRTTSSHRSQTIRQRKTSRPQLPVQSASLREPLSKAPQARATPEWRHDTLKDIKSGQLQKRAQWLHDALAQPRTSLTEKAEFCLWLAKIAYHQNAEENENSARSWLDKALQIQPSCVSAYVLRAQFCIHSSDPKGAQLALQQALYLDANNIEANLCAAQLAQRNNDHGSALRYIDRTFERLQACPAQTRFYFSDGLSAPQLLEFCAQLRILLLESQTTSKARV